MTGARRLLARGGALATLAAVTGVGLLTVAMAPFREAVGLQNAVLLYLLWVLAVAAFGGRRAALIAAVAASVSASWWFIPPLHELGVHHGRDLVTLLAFVVVAVVVSTLVDVAARRRADAYRARLEATSLTGMAALTLHSPDPLPEIAEALVSTFTLDGVAVFSRAPSGGWQVVTAAGPHPPRTPLGADHAVQLADDSLLALSGRSLSPETHQVLDRFATQLALALQGRRLAAEAATAAGLAQANELRNALLAAVSHDLRTPLASIRTAATSLLSSAAQIDPTEARALLETIDVEAERLDALVANLLDMSRLQTGTLGVALGAVSVDEVVGTTLVGLHVHPSRAVLDIPEDLPELHTDPALLERVLANVIGNALHHAPDSEAIHIRARLQDGGWLLIEVADRGRGIPKERRLDVIKPFERLGTGGAPAGIGLGLAVASGFVTAIGGRLAIGDTPGGGATVSIRLPTAPVAPSSAVER